MITKDKLQHLSDNCFRLLYYSESLESINMKELKEYNDTIKQALRKMVIANEMSDRMNICITGLQGTGKTTLIKNYYSLNDSTLNISLGRGERLPVLITENDDTTIPELYSVSIKKGEKSYVTDRTRVSEQEFIEISGSDDENSYTMYMEVLLPGKYVGKGMKFSYLLLPGYEKRDGYWNTLIDFSVQCSDTAVFVLDPSSAAFADNARIMGKIQEQFKDTIIYVITHSDEAEDDNAEIKKH